MSSNWARPAAHATTTLAADLAAAENEARYAAASDRVRGHPGTRRDEWIGEQDTDGALFTSTAPPNSPVFNDGATSDQPAPLRG